MQLIALCVAYLCINLHFITFFAPFFAIVAPYSDRDRIHKTGVKGASISA